MTPKIKDLPFKERMENIWYYYKWHIIIGIALIVIVLSSVNSMFTKPIYIFNLSAVGCCDSTKGKEVSELSDDIVKLIGKTNKRDAAEIDLYGLMNANDTLKNLDYNSHEKLSVKIAAKGVDILVINKSDFDDLIKQEAFVKLDTLKDFDINNKNYNLIKSGSSVYGISVEGNKALEKIGFDTKGKAIGIVAASKRYKASEKVLKWLLNFNK